MRIAAHILIAVILSLAAWFWVLSYSTSTLLKMGLPGGNSIRHGDTVQVFYAWLMIAGAVCGTILSAKLGYSVATAKGKITQSRTYAVLLFIVSGFPAIAA